MQPPFSEVWSDIERSLACAAKSRKAIENAGRLRAESERLRQKSAALLRSSPGSRKELRQQNRLKSASLLAEERQSPQLNFAINLQLNEPSGNPHDI